LGWGVGWVFKHVILRTSGNSPKNGSKPIGEKGHLRVDFCHKIQIFQKSSLIFFGKFRKISEAGPVSEARNFSRKTQKVNVIPDKSKIISGPESEARQITWVGGSKFRKIT